MAYLVDTNVLLRHLEPGTPMAAEARAAVAALAGRGERLAIAPQNLVEFWNAATRPVSRNGFGLEPGEADAEVGRLLGLFELLPETPALFGQWRRLAAVAGVRGVQVHDARLAALMRLHGVDRILTFNVGDFKRFGVTARHLADEAR